MDFGSKFVYNYEDSEDESVSEDEFEEGMERGMVTPIAFQSKSEYVGGGAVATDCAMEPKKLSKSIGGRFRRSRSSETDKYECDAAPPPPVPARACLALEKKSKKPKKPRSWWPNFTGGASKDRESRESAHDRARKKKHRRADTNVVAVKFDHLTAPSNMHTGDPVYCTSCAAVFSQMSKLSPDDLEQVWTCEFCGTKQAIELMDEEKPKTEDVTFMLMPAPSTTASGRSGMDETVVVFCVDTSGSMCVTTEVPGKISMRGDRLQRLQSLNDEHENQFMPGQRKNVTYVSRLQGMQAAVDHQLGEMVKEHPNRRVALITFNSEVTVVGDGTSTPVHLSGDKLNNKEELTQVGTDMALPTDVKASRKKLGDQVFELEEGGQTALGPALMVSVAMACQVPGSKVIICTDGMANIGMGSLDVQGDEEYEQATQFYTDASTMAVDKGVSVSVITMKGTDCKLVELGKVADATQGQVNIVDPLKLTEEFGSILANPIIATNVSATLLLHKDLYFRNEDKHDSKVERYVGNVTKETEITFEYGVRKPKKKKVPTATLR